jgi:hypothetical protein
MKTMFITNPSTIGFTFAIGKSINYDPFTGEVENVMHITLGFLFWTYIINIQILNQNK